MRRTIDTNRPKACTIASQFVQSDAAQARQIVQFSRHVQGRQAPPRKTFVQAGKFGLARTR